MLTDIECSTCHCIMELRGANGILALDCPGAPDEWLDPVESWPYPMHKATEASLMRIIPSDEQWYAGEEALWYERHDREVDFARRVAD